MHLAYIVRVLPVPPRQVKAFTSAMKAAGHGHLFLTAPGSSSLQTNTMVGRSHLPPPPSQVPLLFWANHLSSHLKKALEPAHIGRGHGHTSTVHQTGIQQAWLGRSTEGVCALPVQAWVEAGQQASAFQPPASSFNDMVKLV